MNHRRTKGAPQSSTSSTLLENQPSIMNQNGGRAHSVVKWRTQASLPPSSRGKSKNNNNNNSNSSSSSKTRIFHPPQTQQVLSKKQVMRDPMRSKSIMELESVTTATTASCCVETNSTTIKESKVVVPLPQQQQPLGVVKNFRQARGLTNIYRCAKMDDLVDRVDSGDNNNGDNKNKKLTRAETTILYRAGLILDLRSPSEIRQEKMQWLERAPGGKIHIIQPGGDDQGLVTKEKRGILNLDVLGPKEFALYAERRWLTSPQEQIQMTFYRAYHGDRIHEMRVEALNKRGLFGLNEVILESGRERLCQALKAITLHLEKKSGDLYRPVIIHCVQGKDRTGMLVMLLQSILGVCDEDIIEDYNESEAMIDKNKDDKTREPGKLDRAMMRRAPKRVMAKTLEYLRNKYGSVSPGYLQAIGFDDSWRLRLVTALLLDMDRPKQHRKFKGSRL